jgi:hypothetical protein
VKALWWYTLNNAIMLSLYEKALQIGRLVAACRWPICPHPDRMNALSVG